MKRYTLADPKSILVGRIGPLLHYRTIKNELNFKFGGGKKKEKRVLHAFIALKSGIGPATDGAICSRNRSRRSAMNVG